MADGTLSVRRRQPKATESAAYEQALAVAQAGAYDSLLTGVLPKIGQGSTKGKGKAKPEGDVEEYKVEARRKKRLRHYDRYLKSFKYSAALDAVLKKVSSHHILPSLDQSLTNCADCTTVDIILLDSGAHPQRRSAVSTCRPRRRPARARPSASLEVRSGPPLRRAGVRRRDPCNRCVLSSTYHLTNLTY